MNADALFTDKSKKPVPPPRAQSPDAWNNKPARPPPPKSADLQRQMNCSWTAPAPSPALTPAPAPAPAALATPADSVYVNLGESEF